MPPTDTAVFYISGHGFGHASRQIEIINALRAIRPNLRIVVRTSAPRWLFNLALSQPFSFHHGEPDTGVVQIDSLRVDPATSIDRAWDFHRTLTMTGPASFIAVDPDGTRSSLISTFEIDIHKNHRSGLL